MKTAAQLSLTALACSLFSFSPLVAADPYDRDCGADDAGEFTIAHLATLAHAHAKIEQVLPLLPERMLARYVLMEESGSLQGATPDNPRVILYGNTSCRFDANLLVTFNGDPKERGYAYLEAIQEQGAMPEPANRQMRRQQQKLQQGTRPSGGGAKSRGKRKR